MSVYFQFVNHENSINFRLLLTHFLTWPGYMLSTRMAPASCFPALGTDACFPALGAVAGYMFSYAWLLVFPRLVPVAFSLFEV